MLRRPFAPHHADAALRSQVAIVRALTDEVERMSMSAPDPSLCAQLAEELARLGCRMMETAAALTRVCDKSDEDQDSGVYLVAPRG